jgi:hypothetical protein
VIITNPTLALSSLALITLLHTEAVYCPQGSPYPLLTNPGYYTISTHDTNTTYINSFSHQSSSVGSVSISSKIRTNQAKCPRGSFCSNGLAFLCPGGRYGSEEGLLSMGCSGECKEGFYCPEGSTSPIQILCPLGTFGSVRGLSSATCSGPCLHPLSCPPGSTIRS